MANNDYRPPGSKYLAQQEAAEARGQLAAAYRELLARAPENKVEVRLDPIRRALGLLGDPQTAYRTIHIAGTNGKTSTARMIDSLVRAHDLRVGRYTSPHLDLVTERIAIDGEPIAPAEFVRHLDESRHVLELIDGELTAAGTARLTFYEVLTILAFVAFADAPVDVAVVEVGLGGEWDATNVIDADVAVIAPISYDHQDYLGDTLAEIAAAKAGILSARTDRGEQQWALVARQDDAALEVVRAVAAERGVRLGYEDESFGVLSRAVAVGGQQLSLHGLGGEYRDVFLPLHGEHQAHNAALALAATEALITGGERALGADAVLAGFSAATSPGRLEAVRASPTVLLDAAHNRAGAHALAEALREAFTFGTVVGVVGILADKDAEAILEELEDVLDTIVVTRSSSPRSMDPEDLAELAEEIFGDDRVITRLSLEDALLQAIEEVDAGGDYSGGVIVTGSITTIADARVLLGKLAS